MPSGDIGCPQEKIYSALRQRRSRLAGVRWPWAWRGQASASGRAWPLPEASHRASSRIQSHRERVGPGQRWGV